MAGTYLLVWDAPNMDMSLGSLLGARPTSAFRPRFDAIGRWLLEVAGPDATAEALSRYIERHPEFDPGTSGQRRFLTTGKPGAQHELVEAFWGGPLNFEAAKVAA